MKINNDYIEIEKIKLKDGMIYEGELVDGEPQGQGTMTHPDGSKQEGMWDEGHFIEEDENKN